MNTASSEQFYHPGGPAPAARLLDITLFVAMIVILWVNWAPLSLFRTPLVVLVLAYGALHWRGVLGLISLAPWVLVIPAVSAVSAIWANDAFAALRHAALVSLAIAYGAIFASRLTLRQILVGLVLGHAILAALTLVTMTTVWVGGADGGTALVGVFPHKNVAGLRMVFLMICAVAVLLAPGFSMAMRGIALASLPAAGFIAFASASAGAQILLMGGLPLALFMLIAWRLALSVRGGRSILVLGGLSAVCFGILLTNNALPDSPLAEFLSAFGKDQTYTGRTDLWVAADYVMDENPILGVGTGNYWQGDNGRAVSLATRLSARSADSFSFHNLLLEVRVHLGVVGMLTVIPVFCAVAWTMLRAWMKDQSAINSVFIVFLAFFGLRAIFESELFRGLAFTSFLFWLLGFAAIVALQRGAGSTTSPSA